VHSFVDVLINTPVPNAFVTEMLPQRVFVTTGLFEEFVKNDDELAMIMGHEISHLIKGHSSEGNLIEFMFRGLEITFLMLDPTEGMLSLAIASFLASARNALLASNSREHEREADELGCKLAAMACFDTEKGANIFKRMHDFDVGKGGGGERNIMSSHPASMERYDFVRQLSKTVNPDHYSHCSTLQKQIRGRALTLLRGTKE
jgi:Zn-dependent protease with chaperone function